MSLITGGINSTGDDTFVNIFQNMDNIKKIKLVSYYYDMSLGDTLKFIQLKRHLVLVRYKYMVWEKSAFTPVFEEIIKN